MTFPQKKKNKKRQRGKKIHPRERRYTTTPTAAIYIMGLKFVIKQRPAAQDDENENEGEESTKEEELSNVSLLLEQEKTNTEEDDSMMMRREEEEQEQEEQQKCTAEGVPIAFPDEYRGTSAIIITPDGITMHRTSRGAFKCGQCKYCSQPNLKQKCLYNNAVKIQRGENAANNYNNSGVPKARSAMATSYVVPASYANSKAAVAGAAFFDSDQKQKNKLFAPRKFAPTKGKEEEENAAVDGFIRNRGPMAAQSKYIGIIKTSTAKVVVAKNFDVSKEGIAKTATRWRKEKTRVPNVDFDEEEETEKFGSDVYLWKRQKGESCERPTWTPLPETPPETSEKKEMDEDDKALLQPILPGMDDGQRAAAPRRYNFQSNTVAMAANESKDGSSDVKPLLAVPVPSAGGRVYNDKVDPSLLVVACNEPGCLERFLDRPRMLRHVANAHREKRYICTWENCGKAFVDNSKLQRHIVTHTQEKTFLCDVCNASFGLKFNLHTHLKNVHGILP